MDKTSLFARLIKFKNLLYEKLFKINDTPQKVALGFGLGVFSGIFPGTGPLAALFLALVFKVNRASALIASFLTNTWLSFVTFILAIKIGSAIFRVSWQGLRSDWLQFIHNFTWNKLFSLSILKIVLPVATGYLIVALILGALSYALVLLVLKDRTNQEKDRRR